MGLFSSKCTSAAQLDGKTVIVTGGNAGLGKATVEDFYSRGGRVILACRNLEKAQQAVNDIEAACSQKPNLGTLVIVKLDLSNLESIRECAKYLLDNESRIDILINNAGVMMSPESRTKDGFELQMGINHLGHFLLTMLLLPKICESDPARIVTVTSKVHILGGRIDLEDLNWERKPYYRVTAYQQSKLANILFTKELARRLKENNIYKVTTYTIHPGVVTTNILRYFGRIMTWLHQNIAGIILKTSQQGAQTIIYCALDEKCAEQSGLYYTECAVTNPSNAALSEEDARNLWQISWKMVGLDDEYYPFPK